MCTKFVFLLLICFVNLIFRPTKEHQREEEKEISAFTATQCFYLLIDLLFAPNYEV